MLSQVISAENHNLSEIELMTDRDTLDDLSDTFRDDGGLLVCHFCDDISEVIAGILVVRDREEAWVLCGPCLRKVPVQGALAS